MGSFASPVSSEVERSLRLHTTMRASRAICALIALTLTQFLSAADARAQVRHTIIAASGDAAPAGGNYLFFLSTPASNTPGQVAFDAFLGGPSHSGVFVSDGRTTSVIALGGDPDPAAGNFGFAFAPSLTTRGDVIFITDTGFFRGDGRRAVPLVQSGDPAPGGGSQNLGGGYAANSQGVIAYNTFITGGVSTQGIFRNDGTGTVAIVFDTTVPPTGGTFSFLAEPIIDERGQVAFFAGMTGGSADFAIFRGDGENLTTIFAANQPAPGGGTFLDFGSPVINKRGQVLDFATLDNAVGPNGLFLGDGRDAVAIALGGHAAPNGGSFCRPGDMGCPSAVQFFGYRLNDRGQAAFGAFLTGGASRSGIFRGDGATTTPIALEGTAARGTTGTFDSFGEMTMGEDGRVAFIGTLALGVGGVDASNNTGIWVGTSETDLHLVARTGQVIAGKTLTSLEALGQLQVSGSPVVWRGRFSGFSPAIVSSDLDDEANDLDDEANADRGAGLNWKAPTPRIRNS
jgi:hypothetical protein